MNRLKWPLISALLAVLMAASVVYAQSLPKNPVDWLIAKRVTVSGISTLTGAVTTGGNLTVGSLLTADSANIGTDFDVAGITTLDIAEIDELTLTEQTVITATNGMTLDPTGSHVALTSAAAVGFGKIITTSGPNILFITNIGSQNITITDTGNLKLSGNLVLGADDAAVLARIGTNWYQVSESAN